MKNLCSFHSLLNDLGALFNAFQPVNAGLGATGGNTLIYQRGNIYSSMPDFLSTFFGRCSAILYPV